MAMLIIGLFAIMQVAPADLPKASGTLRLDSLRNPFRRYQAELEWIKNQEMQTEATIQETTESTMVKPWIPSVIGLSPEEHIAPRLLPPLLRDLKGIAIMHERNSWAMFGDRIVSVSDTLEGFTVLSISFDGVTFSNSQSIVEVDLAKRHTTVRSDTSDPTTQSGKNEP